MAQEVGVREVLEQLNLRLTRLEDDLRALRQEVRQEVASLRRDMWRLLYIMLAILIPMWVSIILAIVFSPGR